MNVSSQVEESLKSATADASEPIVLAMRPPSESRDHAEKVLTRVNLALIAVMVLFALLLGWGDVQTTLRYLSEYATNLMLGASYVGILTILSRKLVGKPDFWYSFHENRLCYHRPPRFEEIPYEDIRELRRIPMTALPYIAAEDAFCLYLKLKNGRELRLFGMVNLHQAWKFLSSRLSELVVEPSRATNEVSAELLPLSRLGWWFFLGVRWFVAVFWMVPEKLAASVILLGLACAPVPYLLRYFRYGRPASEDYLVFVCAGAGLFGLFGAVAVYFWG